MRVAILLSVACFLLFGTTSCEEDLPRVNVAVSVQFDVQTSIGEPFPGVQVHLFANKFSLASGKAIGTAFSHTAISGPGGVVDWSGRGQVKS